jgi:4-amino-4-deoxy-L-arabinose transferase-like glycosyltransferase
MRNLYINGALLLSIATFVAAGLCLIPFPGLQTDEALFGWAIYAPRETTAYIEAFHGALPVMLMAYLGALKAWLYTPILAVWEPSAWSIRFPVLMLGAATIWLFFKLLDRLQGKRAALLGCALLATDPTFLLTTCFDWGPVVLQRFLSVAGVLLLVKYHRSSSQVCLGAAFFLFGLALWDKALFGWSLAGYLAGALSIIPGAVRRKVGVRSLALALVCFCAGAYPLARYNQLDNWATFRGTVGWSAQGLGQKLTVLRRSLDGSGLMGYMTYDDPADHQRAPHNLLERASVALDSLAGRPHRGPLPYCMIAAVIAIPFLWRTQARRPMLFALVYMIVTWGLMFFGRGAGGSVHHVALLWPWPHFLVAVAGAELSRHFRRMGRAVIVVFAVLVCGWALLVSNTSLSQFVRNGSRGSWTDAIYALSAHIERVSPRGVVALDWGLIDSLRILHQGNLPLIWGAEPLLRNPQGPDDERAFRQMIEIPDRLFISFTDSQEQIAGVNGKLRAMLATIGATREILAVIHDSNGRPVYEVCRIRKF